MCVCVCVCERERERVRERERERESLELFTDNPLPQELDHCKCAGERARETGEQDQGGGRGRPASGGERKTSKQKDSH